MIDIIYSIIAGLVQGLTEFLPVSSSGHLIIFHEIFNLNFPDQVAFDVVLHLGTLTALLLFFYKDLIELFLAWLRSFVQWDFKGDLSQRLSWLLIIGTIPAGLAGFFLEELIDAVFRNIVFVALALILFGIILYIVDKFALKIRQIKDLEIIDIVVIGIAQILALVPGVSRSGITIIAGLQRKLKRDQAARFSFLLSIPIIAAAGLKKLLDLLLDANLNSSEYPILIAGYLASAIVGYLCIKYFLKFVERYSLAVSAIYRVILGLIILAWYLL